jgi:uncharacterized membrane protein YhaH (DUF805 family)
MAGTRRSRRAWAVPLLLVLAIVIVAALAFNLANLEPAGNSAPRVPRSDEGLSDAGVSLPDPIAIVVLQILAAITLVGMLFLFVRRRKDLKRSRTPFSRRNVLASVVTLALLIALLIVWPRAMPFPEEGQNPSNTTADGPLALRLALGSGWPVELFLIVSIMGSLLLILYRVRRNARSFAGGLGAGDVFPEVRDAASEVVQDAIHDLEIGGDVRTTILACFQRFCRLLGSRGITKQVALTPRELESLAVRRLAVSHEASEILTSLFEEARYSEHALGDGDRHRAIESLGRIQASLEA